MKFFKLHIDFLKKYFKKIKYALKFCNLISIKLKMYILKTDTEIIFFIQVSKVEAVEFWKMLYFQLLFGKKMSSGVTSVWYWFKNAVSSIVIKVVKDYKYIYFIESMNDNV